MSENREKMSENREKMSEKMEKMSENREKMSENREKMEKELQDRAAIQVILANVGSKEVIQNGKIQKVTEVLRGREELVKYFEPKWMSFGPIHYGESKFKASEKYKFNLIAKFIHDGNYSSANELYEKIKSEMTGLRGCFEEDVIQHLDDETLNWILFFDGCAILQFINSRSKKDHFKELKIKNDQVAFIQHDLFLLENQIPYQVLKVLLNHSTKEKTDQLLTNNSMEKEQLQKSFNEFINANVMVPGKQHTVFKIEEDKSNPEPAHLLDLLRLALLQPPAGSHSRDSKQKHENNDGQQSFRSVHDLRASGIIMKPSKTCSLKDIKFSSTPFVRKLELPPLIVDDSMAPKFMNLIAYEMCPNNTQTEYEVTSYICFLDSLIDYPADVKELRTSDILHNLLGCDKQVAKLFNEIATDLVPNPEVYKKVIHDIEKHYKSKWMTWIAQVINDHFSTPWTIVAFLAAVIALFMSGIQTWFTVHPAPGS